MLIVFIAINVIVSSLFVISLYWILGRGGWMGWMGLWNGREGQGMDRRVQGKGKAQDEEDMNIYIYA